MTSQTTSPKNPPRRALTPATEEGRQRIAKCGRCGACQTLTIPPAWDRRTFVQTYCTKCAYRFLLPTRSLILWRNLALIAFPLCVWFVIRTILHGG